MTDAPPALSRPSAVLRLIVASPLTLWVAFVAVHLYLGLLALYAPGLPLGDVTLVYRFWIEQALGGGLWVGIDTAWVYPLLALVPMLVANLFGPDQYGATWLSMVMVLNAVAFGFVTGWGRRPERVPAGWWWIGFLFLLGPIALARIDSITVPIALVGVLLLAARPFLASALLAVATWIKVWPAALVLAALISVRDRLRVVAGAATVTAVVLVGALLLGASSSVLSFVTEQTGRGLQIEAPVSTVWMWMARAGVPGAHVYYDTGILTYQVEGPGWQVAAAMMTPLLAVVVATIAGLALVAVRRGAAVGDLLPPLALALVTALIAVNKVGSPQFVSWLAVPVVLGLVTSASGWGRSFRVPGVLVLVIAGLTHVIYPYLYNWLLSLDLLLLVVLTARNLLYFALLAWAVHAIVTAPRWADEHDLGETGPQTVWPIRLAEGSIHTSKG
ncbi:glycosyltransferase family 87 protein [Schumannella luteola]